MNCKKTVEFDRIAIESEHGSNIVKFTINGSINKISYNITKKEAIDFLRRSLSMVASL